MKITAQSLRTSPVKFPIERLRKGVNGVLYATVLAFCLFAPPSELFHPAHRWMQLEGLICVLVAILGRLWCGIYVFGRKSKELVTDGPYSLCRNPLYIFSFLGGLGVAAQTGSIAVAVIFSLGFWSCYYQVIRAEEKRLLTLYGSEYELYCDSVPRLLPRLQGYRTCERLDVPVRAFSRLLWKGIWPALAVVAADLILLLRSY